MSSKEYVKSLKVENFTVLPNENFEFSKNLNVIVAENGCGKTHLLKLIYSLLEVTSNEKNRLIKTDLQKSFANKLVNVFRPDGLGRLTKRVQGRVKANITLELNQYTHSLLNFSTTSTTEVKLEKIGLK
ncbi:AAA family ATPase [Neisseria weixii]|uniref:AAA family ATPase n=1 Tax=Neisseria weixii TaxID=1853276 RepID=UPI001F438405|nr:AAA family ATPase [Neisseria weixii]